MLSQVMNCYPSPVLRRVIVEPETLAAAGAFAIVRIPCAGEFRKTKWARGLRCRQD